MKSYKNVFVTCMFLITCMNLDARKKMADPLFRIRPNEDIINQIGTVMQFEQSLQQLGAQGELFFENENNIITFQNIMNNLDKSTCQRLKSLLNPLGRMRARNLCERVAFDTERARANATIFISKADVEPMDID